ncbi:MAG: uridine kinase family protein [Pyrinomonadaceae bacterium]
MAHIDDAVARILNQRAILPEDRSLLVGISGIDGSGKGFVAAQIEAHLAQHAIAAARINVDDWLKLPDERFSPIDPGKHFYEHAIRFDEFFTQLVLPLRDHRSLSLSADFAEETARKYRKHTYSFKNVGVILVEGIFLFKREQRKLFDLAIWTDCSFPTALARALKRGQEGLPPAATIWAYETVYFPAQRIHQDRDNPQDSADLVLDNDPYLNRPLWYLANPGTSVRARSAH